MFTDLEEIEEIRERIIKERPRRLFNRDGEFYGHVWYGKSYGKPYADIGWCLPVGCCVVLEDHGDSRTMGVPLAIRIWL
jgi:hypothetical protein